MLASESDSACDAGQLMQPMPHCIRANAASGYLLIISPTSISLVTRAFFSSAITVSFHLNESDHSSAYCGATPSACAYSNTGTSSAAIRADGTPHKFTLFSLYEKLSFTPVRKIISARMTKLSCAKTHGHALLRKHISASKIHHASHLRAH